MIGTARAASAQGAIPAPMPAEELGLPVPGSREGMYLETEDGARIFYQVAGEGEPMLLHGYPFSGALFSRNVDALAQEYMVITVDHRGYGMSEAPAVPADIATYATDAMAVLDDLGVDQAVIGGHSMGGPITFKMYQVAPERFRGMILIDTIAAPANTIEQALWSGFITGVEQSGISKVYINALMKNMLSGDTRVNDQALVAYLAQIMEQVSVDAAIGGAKALSTRDNYTDLLPKIEVPALVTVGIEDTYYPVPISKAMAQVIPNSTLVVIPDASHAANYEAPDDANQAILDWASGLS